MDEAIFDNPYVQTAVPLAMGIAAASSPAGARGASALLTTLGTMQQFSQHAATRKVQQEGLRLREREVAVHEPSPMELQAREMLSQRLNRVIPPAGGPEAQGPPAPPTTESRMQALEELESTGGGRALMALGGPPGLQRYVTSVGRREPKATLGTGKIPPFVSDTDLNAQIYADWGDTLRTPDGQYAQPTPAMIRSSADNLRQITQENRVQVARETGAIGQLYNVQGMRERATIEQESFRLPETTQRQIRSLNDALGLAESLDDFTKEEAAQWVGVIRNPAYGFAQLLKSDPRFAKFMALQGRLEASLFFASDEGGGKALTAKELEVLRKSVVTGREWGGLEEFEAKRKVLQTYLNNKIRTTMDVATMQPGKPGIDYPAQLKSRRLEMRKQLDAMDALDQQKKATQQLQQIEKEQRELLKDAQEEAGPDAVKNILERLGKPSR